LLAGLVDGDFADAGLGIGDELVEAGVARHGWNLWVFVRLNRDRRA
jgi:hypothetical protein